MICFYKTTKTLSSITWRNPYFPKFLRGGGLEMHFFERWSTKGSARLDDWCIIHGNRARRVLDSWVVRWSCRDRTRASGHCAYRQSLTPTAGSHLVARPRPWFCKAVGLREQHKYRGQALVLPNLYSVVVILQVKIVHLGLRPPMRKAGPTY